jgi:glutaminyl-tRNA synthetase
MSRPDDETPRNFIREIIDEDLAAGRFDHVQTRFPPEPNGYLHIGHAKAISIDFGTAAAYDGGCNLRMDDTNPSKEEAEYVEAIQEDVRWLGYEWDNLCYASDCFPFMYECAVELIRKGLAYVDSLPEDEIRRLRGTAVDRSGGAVETRPGTPSPYRDRSVEENLDLFARMKAGEFADGAHVLRAKIDMAHPNLNMRDPIMYRILRATHHRTGDAWCIYPMYDWAHGLEDSYEGVTHSLCDLSFENHRPLYNWFLENLDVHRPRQIEFARLNLTHTVLSKRRLLPLVAEGHVTGWDDPRLPTLRGLRRRGYPPAAIRSFCERIGVAKTESTIDIQLLEHCVREELNRTANRLMGVLDPLKVVIENYPVDAEEELTAVNNPEDEAAGTRRVPFSRELWIERDDFMEEPVRKFRRLAPGREVRLRYAYFVTCTDVVKDADGRVTELRCTYDPETRGGDAPDGRKVKGTLHWVSARHAVPCQARLYDHLFSAPQPGQGKESFLEDLNPESLRVLDPVYVEPAIREAPIGVAVQFERQGYFCPDPDGTPEAPVVDRTVTLKDSWAKQRKKKKT